MDGSEWSNERVQDTLHGHFFTADPWSPQPSPPVLIVSFPPNSENPLHGGAALRTTRTLTIAILYANQHEAPLSAFPTFVLSLPPLTSS